MARYNRKWQHPIIFNGKIEGEDVRLLDSVSAEHRGWSRAWSLHQLLASIRALKKNNPWAYKEFFEDLGG